MAEDQELKEEKRIISGMEKRFKDLTEEMMRQKELFGFETAIAALKDGFRVYRHGWNGKRMWIKLQRPTEKSMMTRPYIFMKTVNDELVPWVASQTDILADDWDIVK